jgi:hypothetical protein
LLRLAGERASATLGVQWATSGLSQRGVGRSGCKDRNGSCLRGRSAAGSRCSGGRWAVQRWAARRVGVGVSVSCFEERGWRRARSATLHAAGRWVGALHWRLEAGASGGWVGTWAASEAAVRGRGRGCERERHGREVRCETGRAAQRSAEPLKNGAAGLGTMTAAQARAGKNSRV